MWLQCRCNATTPKLYIERQRRCGDAAAIYVKNM